MEVTLPYTVKQLASLAKVSRRTLHYYDQIGLLSPQRQPSNGYRCYSEQSLFRLQQILFYKELGVELEQIRRILDDPDFNQLQALQDHYLALCSRRTRLERLIETVERTIMSLKGEIIMSDEGLFKGFDDPQEKEYAQQAVAQWGEEAADSIRKWNAYSPQKQAQIRAESQDIYISLAALVDRDPGDPEVQAIIARWHEHMRYFYEPSIERLRGLGEMYVESPDFRATFDRIHPDLAIFMRRAISIYCERKDLNAKDSNHSKNT